MVRSELYRELAKSPRIVNEVGLNLRESKIIVEEIFRIIYEELEGRGYVGITHFGKFEVQDWGPKDYIMPDDGRLVHKEHEYRIRFLPCDKLKAAVKKEY